jgi:DNA-binding response OmpR family regulator
MNVVAAVTDLFFVSRLEPLTRRSEVNLTVVSTTSQLANSLERDHPELVLVDLGARGLDPIDAIRLARGAGVARIVAFGPHKDLTARSAALDAGATDWITNQRLVETMVRLCGDALASPGKVHAEPFDEDSS